MLVWLREESPSIVIMTLRVNMQLGKTSGD